MPLNSCPHYLDPGAGPTGRCRGCGSIVTNPSHPQAQAEGKVHPSGQPKSVKAPGN